jgi:hypothetical protein
MNLSNFLEKVWYKSVAVALVDKIKNRANTEVKTVVNIQKILYH